MTLSEFLCAVKDELPEKAIDLSESLELLKEVINDTLNDMSNKMSIAYSKRDFENSRKYMRLGEFINEYEIKINEIIGMLEVEDASIIHENEIDEETEKKTIPNYSEYIVDTNVEHTLYENFTHIRPFGFKLNNHFEEVKTWQEMLVKTAQYLMSLNRMIIYKFCDMDSMNGKKNKYFTNNPEILRNPSQISKNLYVETNMSSNGIRNLIIKMLKEYGFKSNDYKVYFRADYTGLNKE